MGRKSCGPARGRPFTLLVSLLFRSRFGRAPRAAAARITVAMSEAGSVRSHKRGRRGLVRTGAGRLGTSTTSSRMRAGGQRCAARRMLSEALRAVEPCAARRRLLRAGSRATWCWLLPRAVEPAQKPRLKAEAAARRKPRRAVEAAPEAGSCAARRKLEAAAAVRARIELRGQGSADGPPAAPRPRGLELCLL